MNLVKLSEKLMLSQFEKNQAPPLLLTRLAIEKGKKLARSHNVDEELVLTSLYLAHTVFDKIWGGPIQCNHPELSAAFVEKYLNAWKVSEEKKEIILNAILAHHNKVEMKSKVAEVMRNAECFKFITVEGCLIYFHELGLRGENFENSVDKVIKKLKQKEALLTLEDCKKEAQNNIVEINKIFDFDIK